MRRVVIVNDKMQQGYCHELSPSVGRDFDPVRWLCEQIQNS
jgi:hypothetical protein